MWSVQNISPLMQVYIYKGSRFSLNEFKRENKGFSNSNSKHKNGEFLIKFWKGAFFKSCIVPPFAD